MEQLVQIPPNPQPQPTICAPCRWCSYFSFLGRLLCTLYFVYGVTIIFGWQMQYLIFITTTNYSSKPIGILYIIVYTIYGVIISNVMLLPLWDFLKLSLRPTVLIIWSTLFAEFSIKRHPMNRQRI